ncbi:hypothetical protein, partial [Mesorhizobium sp.]
RRQGGWPRRLAVEDNHFAHVLPLAAPRAADQLELGENFSDLRPVACGQANPAAALGDVETAPSRVTARAANRIEAERSSKLIISIHGSTGPCRNLLWGLEHWRKLAVLCHEMPLLGVC